METRLPAPSLIVLVGPGASGKSTWAEEHFAANEIVSSDALRAVVGTGPADQQGSEAAFDLLERIVAERISRQLTTVIDTLGFDTERRRAWIDLAHDQGLGVYAVLFETSADECLRRNEHREKRIPRSVLRKQVTRFTQVSGMVQNEGFDGVLRPRSVAVVPPQIAQAPNPKGERPSGHTFGLIVSRFEWPGGADQRAAQLAAIARRAEEAGFRDLWVMDHFRQIRGVGRPWEDIPESYTTLAYLAGQTERIRLGTLVTGVTYRNPALLGKMVATLDVLSGGRANCGIGIGWDRAEHEGYGWVMPTTRERYDLLEDTLEMLPLLWGKGSPTFDGRVFTAEALTCYPRPIQEKIPILIGGSGEKRTLRLVAEHADACNVFGPPERVAHKVKVLHGHCQAVGRDPTEVEITHLVSVMTATDRAALRERAERMKGRNESYEEFARQHNAGTVDDQLAHFGAYSQAGAQNSIVSLPDVHLEGSIEAFGDVIANLSGS